ncbi:GIY-YIG nuclease family protein [Arenimonas sp. MALMAid1274]|uniref:GIY-YIG nuclease family protein n=1 Tax=Arenimonas sp. MALMAid1274 TaxID=3411630 RepID=UPI003BA19B6F
MAPNRSPSHLYLFPDAHEDLLKLGMSRRPLARIEAFHRRWYEAFDLDRGLLLETETGRDARELELRLGRALRAHNAPMPLLIRGEAGGHTEWYRGAYAPLAEALQALAAQGYRLHAPLRPWLREALLERADQLYAWGMGALDQASLRPGEGGLERLTPGERQMMRDALDAYPALDIDLAPRLPPEVMAWYRG